MGAPSDRALLRITSKGRLSTPTYPQPVEGVIVTATTTGATVTFASGTAVGAVAPLPPGLTEAPAAGTRCLIVFSASGLPWVIGLTDIAAP